MVNFAVFFPCRLPADIEILYREILSHFWYIRICPVDSESKPLVRNDNFYVVQYPLDSGLEVDGGFVDISVVVRFPLTKHNCSVHPNPCCLDAIHTLVVDRWPRREVPFRWFATFAGYSVGSLRPYVCPSPVVKNDRSLEEISVAPIVIIGMVFVKHRRCSEVEVAIT